MPSEKEIEWAIHEISLTNNFAGYDLPAQIMRDAYISMKSERDRYRTMIEAVNNALSAVVMYCAPDLESAPSVHYLYSFIDGSFIREKEKQNG